MKGEKDPLQSSQTCIVLFFHWAQQCWILDALGFIFPETSEVSWDREEMICQGFCKLDLPRLKTDIEMQWVFISIQHFIVGKNAAFLLLNP